MNDQETKKTKRFTSRGATAVEYALIVALIAAVIIIAVGSLGTKTQGLYNTTTTEMTGAGI